MQIKKEKYNKFRTHFLLITKRSISMLEMDFVTQQGSSCKFKEKYTTKILRKINLFSFLDFIHFISSCSYHS